MGAEVRANQHLTNYTIIKKGGEKYYKKYFSFGQTKSFGTHMCSTGRMVGEKNFTLEMN